MKLYFKVLIILAISYSTFNLEASELTCYSAVYAPYSFEKDGKPAGIDIDIVSEIAKKIDISVSFKIIPWSRLIRQVRAGEIDCAAAFLKPSKYAKNMFYMKKPITTGNYTLFIESKNKNSLKNITDFYGHTIAINRGFKIPFVLKQAIANNLIKKYEVGDEKQSLQMLSSSRIKGVLTDKSVGLYNLHELKIKNITFLPKHLISTPVYLVFSKQWEENGVIEQFDLALEALKKDGTYQSIIDKHHLH